MDTVIIRDIPSDEKGRLYAPSGHALMKAVSALRSGDIVAFPTETVYGLGANALLPEAAEKIYSAKGRPADNPLIVHVAEISDIVPLVRDIPAHAVKLMEDHMPGPVTLVFRKSDIIPDEVTSGLDTVAIRIPSHPVARLFLSLAGVPVAAPSANISGKPSPTSAFHVIEDFGGKIPFIIDGGDCEIGLESTVIDVTGDFPVILRPGFISEKDIFSCCVSSDDADLSSDRPRSPGMKYRHYAPGGEVLPAGPFEDPGEGASVIKPIIMSYVRENKRIGVFSSYETLEILASCITGFIPLPYGKANDVRAASAELFRALRKADKLGLDLIIVEAFPESGVGVAYMNRVKKASGSQDKEKTKVSKVLFVCTGNTCRSPMAEYYVNSISEKSSKLRLTASSAGIATIDGLMASGGAIDAMRVLYGIDISAHRSEQIRRESIENSDLVITMTQRHRNALLSSFPEFSDKIHTLYEFASGEKLDIPDPFGAGDDIYIKIAKEVCGLTDKLIEKLSR